MTENRRQRTEDRGQRTDDRGQRIRRAGYQGVGIRISGYQVARMGSCLIS